jgi:peptidoglycan biosynthesis protein MviN/MurJ (putative lipid II flippase)
VFKIALNIFAAALVGGAILLQDYALARNFGISETQDFYQFTYLIASNLWNVLSGGTYFAIAVPLLLSQRSKNNDSKKSDIYFKFFTVYFLIVVAICLLGYYFLTLNTNSLIKNSIQILENDLAIKLLAISIPIHLSASYFFVKVVCQKMNFVATMSSSLIYLAIPTWAIFYSFNTTEAALAVCAGIVMQLGTLVMVSHLNKNIKHAPHAKTIITSRAETKKIITTNIIEIFKIIISALLVALLNWLISAEYANQGVGEVSKFLYATKPSNMAAAFLTIVIANYLLASFSETAANKEYKKLRKDVMYAYKIVFSISLFIVFFWYFASEFFYQIMFYKSTVTFDTIGQIQLLSNVAIFQLPLYMIGVVAWRGLNALSRNNEILKASIASVILFYVLKIVLPINFEYKILVIYISTYLLWGIYLMLSMSLATKKLIQETGA